MEIALFEQYPIIQFISYFITAVIGSVGFKYYKQWSENKIVHEQHEEKSTQLLIQNLQNRVDKLTTDLIKFEKERTEIHKRELAREKELAESRAEVRILTNKVAHLEESLQTFRDIIKEYRKKYGRLDNV